MTLPTLVQSATAYESLANGVTVTLDDPPTAGNLLVLWHTTRGNRPGSNVDGWTQHPDGFVPLPAFFNPSVFDEVASMWWKISDGTETSTFVYSVDGNAGQRATVAEFSGAGSPIDTGSDEGNGAAVNTGSVTPPSGDPVLVVGGIVINGPDSSTSIVPDSGWVEIVDLIGDGDFAPHHWLVYQSIESASGSYDPSGTFSAADRNFGGQTIAFLEAEPVPTPGIW